MILDEEGEKREEEERNIQKEYWFDG